MPSSSGSMLLPGTEKAIGEQVRQATGLFQDRKNASCRIGSPQQSAPKWPPSSGCRGISKQRTSSCMPGASGRPSSFNDFWRKPSARTKDHLPQHGAAFKSDMVGDAFLREELEQVGQDHVDFNVPNIPRAGTGGHLPKLIGCQHSGALSTLSFGTSDKRSSRRA